MASFYPKKGNEGGGPLDAGRVAASLRSGAARQETLAKKAASPPTPAQLLHRALIAKENSSDDVLRIAEEKLQELDANSCATAIHKVAQLCRKRSAAAVGRDPRLSELLRLALPLSTAWSSRQLCHVVWSMATLSMGGRSQQLLDQVCLVFGEKLWEGVPQDLSTFAWALAALLVDNPSFDVIMRASMERLTEFGVQDLAITAWSLTKLLYKERRPMLTAIAQESILKLKEFGGRNLSSISWVGLWKHPSCLGCPNYGQPWPFSSWSSTDPSFEDPMAWFGWFLFLFADLLLILWLCFGDLAKVWAHWRAEHAPRRLRVFLNSTFGFDGLLKTFHCHSVSPEGEVRGSIKAEAPLLDDQGALDVGAVALLLDGLTGFALWSSGTIGFVTAELSFQLRGSAKRGDELFIKAWVKQPPRMPEDKRLREFAMLAFELFRGPRNEGDDPYVSENLVAEGEQLMVTIATPLQRLHWKLQLLCPPFFERTWQGGMKILATHAQHALPVEEIRTLKQLAALKSQGDGNYEAQLQLRQLNVNGVGHGAATASLLCLATADFLSQPVLEAKFFYLSPTPGMTPVLLEIKPSSKTPGQVQVFLRKEKGSPPIIRGTIKVATPPPAIPAVRHVLPGLRNVIPQISKLHRVRPEKNESPNTNSDVASESIASDSDAGATANGTKEMSDDHDDFDGDDVVDDDDDDGDDDGDDDIHENADAGHDDHCKTSADGVTDTREE
eukprot:s22_g13.t1